MPRIRIEPVPPSERTPQNRYQMTVDGSIVSRHATKAKARERKREALNSDRNTVKHIAEKAAEAAKAGSPVDATLDTMDETGIDDLARASNTQEPEMDDDEDAWGYVEELAMLGGDQDEERDRDDEDRGGMMFADPFGLGGDH